MAPASNAGTRKRTLETEETTELKKSRNSDDFSEFQKRIRAKHGGDREDKKEGKYLRYMKVQTLADGSKVRTILGPDDPILDEYEINKQDLAGKLENNMKVTFHAPKSRMDQIHREERKRISPPRENSVRDRIGVKSSSASKMSMDREKQKSVKSRLSITTSSTSSVSKHDPRARKRITGPPEEDDLRSRLGSSRRSY